MFGMGMPEILLILAVALIVIGPKKLPDLAKSLGRAMGEFKRATNDFKETMEIDSQLSEVRKTFDEMNDDVRKKFDDATASPPPTAKASAGDKPAAPAGETPPEAPVTAGQEAARGTDPPADDVSPPDDPQKDDPTAPEKRSAHDA